MKSNIRNLRKERKISQTELADAIGLSQQVVSRMESDRSCIRVRSLIALADYFQVSTDEILGYESEAAKEERIRLEKELEVETACHLPEGKPVSAAEQSAVYNFLVSMKRCLEECGI